MEPIKDINLDEAKSSNDIVNQMKEAGGFTSKNIGIGVDILEEMSKESECVKFLSFPACILATGMRGIIRDLIKNKMIDVIITTCGTLDHDIARSFKDYYHGSFKLDDKELHQKGIERLGNIIFPNDNHGIIIEDKLKPILEKLEKKEWNTKELIWEIGKHLNESSILYWAEKNKIPVIVPGITDGTAGSQLWMHWQNNKDFKINLFEDEQALADIVFPAKKSGALILGGGISKHHTLWWNQFRGGLDYAVYITTAVEFDGSLSGAETREAISWGKIKENAKHITINSDITAVLPLMIKALKERL